MELRAGLTGAVGISDGYSTFKSTVGILPLKCYLFHISSFNLLIKSAIWHLYRIGIAGAVTAGCEKLEEIPCDQDDNDNYNRANEQRGSAISWPAAIVTVATIVIKA